MKFQVNETVIKVALVAFNFIFSILSVALIALGVVYSDDLALLRRYVGLEFLELPTLLIVLGCLSFVASLVGCYCARTDCSRLIKLFIVFLSLLLALELTIALIAFLNLDNSESTKTRSIMESLFFNANGTGHEEFNNVEKYYKCCGLDGAEDYLRVCLYSEPCPDIPKNWCCQDELGECTMEYINSTATNLHPGCVETVANFIQQIAVEIGCYGAVFSILQVLEMVCLFLKTLPS